MFVKRWRKAAHRPTLTRIPGNVYSLLLAFLDVLSSKKLRNSLTDRHTDTHTACTQTGTVTFTAHVLTE